MGEVLEVRLAGERFRVRAEDEAQARFWREAGEGAALGALGFAARHARPGTVFVDVGAWIGAVSLLAARRGARVTALEPDPVARRALERNLALNGLRAQVIPAALHDAAGGLTLWGGSRGLGASTTSALGASRRDPIHVDAITPEELAVRAGPGPAAVKVDMEGHEYAVGAALARLRALLGGEGGAAMHLAVHPRLLAKRLRRDWVLFPRRRAWAATRALLGQFGDAPMRLSGDDRPLTPALLEATHGPRGDGRNFAVEIGPAA